MLHGGADGGILFHEAQNLVLLDAVRMRVFPAGFGPNVINRTVVVRPQEGAWQGLQDPVLVFIYPEVLRFKRCRLHAQMLGDTLSVAVRPKRARRLAAVGAVEAIDFLKGLVVQVVHHRIQVAGRLGLELLEEFGRSHLGLTFQKFLQRGVHPFRIGLPAARRGTRESRMDLD